MTPEPAKPKSRGVGKAALVLLAVYVIGIFTGVGGGLFLIQRKVRQTLHGSIETRGPIDFIFAEMAADVAREAALTPDERAALHERMQVLAREFKQSRIRLAGEMRDSVRREVEAVTNRVSPTRRERLRAVIQKRIDRWGLAPREASPSPTTPAPAEKL